MTDPYPSPYPSTSSSIQSSFVSLRKGRKEAKYPDVREEEFQKKKRPAPRAGSVSPVRAAHRNNLDPPTGSAQEQRNELKRGRSFTQSFGLELANQQAVHVDPPSRRSYPAALVPLGSGHESRAAVGPFLGPLPPPPNQYGAVRKGKRERPIIPDEHFYIPPPPRIPPPPPPRMGITDSQFNPGDAYLEDGTYPSGPEILSRQSTAGYGMVKEANSQGNSTSSMEKIISKEFRFLDSTTRSNSGPNLQSQTARNNREVATENYRYMPIGQPEPYFKLKSTCLLIGCISITFLFCVAYAGSLPFVVESEHQSINKDTSSNGVALFFERLLVPIIIMLLLPVAALYVPLHPKSMLIFGTLLAGFSFLCFGMIFIGSTVLDSISWAILFRVLQGFGGSALLSCTFSITASQLTGYLFSATVWQIGGILLAFVIGPALRQLCMGSSEGLVYWILGSMLVLLALAMVPCMTPQFSTAGDSWRIAKLLKLPSVWLVMLSATTLGITVAVYFASLWARLHDATYTGAKVGILFVFFLVLVSLALYVTSMMLKKKPRFMAVSIIFGATSNLVGVLIFGGFSGQKPSILSYGLLEIFVGIGSSLLAVPLFFQLIEISRSQKIAETLKSYALLSGLFLHTFWTGIFFGLVLCLYGFHSMGYLPSKLIVAAGNILLMLFLIVHLVCRRKKTGSFEWNLAPDMELRQEFKETLEYYDESVPINPSLQRKYYGEPREQIF